MSTTASPIRNLKSRLPTSNSINNMSTNGNESNAHGIYRSKPLSTTNLLQNYSPMNKLNHHFKTRAGVSNTNHHHHHRNRLTKSTSIDENKPKINQQQSSPSPPSPIIFHVIAPAPVLEENNHITKETHSEQKPTNEPMSESSRRIANVLANTRIKTMSNAISSGSDEEGESSLHRSHDQSSSSIDTDADESDHEMNNNNSNTTNSKQTTKSRRVLKTRKNNFSTISQNNVHTPPVSRTNLRKDEPQQSSSNDEDDEVNSINDDIPLNNTNRRLKFSLLKKRVLIQTTTTTDDDTSKYYRYHPLDNLEFNRKNLPSESASSSPVPTASIPMNLPSTRKANRFQIKSIRKSQQQHILLANAAAAKSSNDDDCSVPNQCSKILVKPTLAERKHTNTPTTDGENHQANTDHIVNGALSALKTVENGHNHRVRFQVSQQKKPESAAEEEKIPVQAVSLPPTPAPSSSITSAQEDEEEAVAKSPDNRFIKYAKEIGRGAFKTVYRGLDTETSVAVAWCELQDFAQFDKHERARFKEEAEMLKKLQHQNIVRFYDFWEETNPRTNKKVIILVTELMTSGSLKGYIRNFKGQKEEKRINVMKKWCRQILKGLAYLHSRNPPVIHRDLKCDNVFISSTTGCVKIGDLGLATFKTQTFAKSMRGTMEFMAPEMFDEKYDELVDIYSFGLCMLEMITGEYPYIECKGPTAVIKRVTAGLKPDCYYKVESEDVREVIDCCIRTKTEERVSVHELLQHSFFMDDNGLRIDLVRDAADDSVVSIKNDTIDLKLKITDKAKRKALYAEHKVLSTSFEAILFPYNLTTDTPEQIADELIGKHYILDEDKKFVIQSIKDRVRAMNYEIIDRQAGVFPAHGKTSINQTSQPPIITQPPQQQQQQQQQPQQPQVTPALSAPPPANFVPIVPPVLPASQPVPIEAQQQQQSLAKPVPSTEPTPISPMPELSSNIPGPAGSLEVLEAALKKTFNKNNAPQGTSTLANDPSEPPASLITQDDPSVPKPATNTTTTEAQQPEDTRQSLVSESLINNIQPSTSTILQTQSQPTTMLTNHQQQMIQNSHLLNQPPQSFSYSPIPSSQHVVNNIIPLEPVKQATLPPSFPSSTTSVVPETIENSHTSISPSPTPSSISHISEAVQPSVPSDAQQPSVSGSLQQLEVLLMNTFKKPNKASGTAHSSDGEAANTNTPSLSSVPLVNNNDDRNEMEPTTTTTIDSSLIPDEKQRANYPIPSSQQSIQKPSQLSESTHFDPLISTDNENLQELETLLQSTPQKYLPPNESRTISPSATSTNDEISDLKSMIMNLSQTLLNKMHIIETKIDDHCSQTRKINQMLTNTILPSLGDITDIIQETSSSNLDARVRTKLENIQVRIRTTLQHQQTEMKDLMDI